MEPRRARGRLVEGVRLQGGFIGHSRRGSKPRFRELTPPATASADWPWISPAASEGMPGVGSGSTAALLSFLMSGVEATQ